jgi:hypothetical protein
VTESKWVGDKNRFFPKTCACGEGMAMEKEGMGRKKLRKRIKKEK